MTPQLRSRVLTSLALLALTGLSGRASAQERGRYLNLEYGRAATKSEAAAPLLLDLYVPDGDGPFPLIVWIHGGAWLAGSKDLRAGGPQRRQLGRGYAVASVEYRLSRQAKFPAQINDCKAAVRWLRAHAVEYRLDADRIGVWGSSAGGHLVALLGTSGGIASPDGVAAEASRASIRVQAVLDWFGPTDLTQMDDQLRAQGCPPRALTHNHADSPESQLLGCTVPSCGKDAGDADPIRYVSSDDPPFCIQHGSADCTVPYRQSVALYNALRAVGVEARLDLFGDTGHGGPAFTSEANNAVVDAFWDKHLKR
jgi:acetyl esterase/lipase